MENGARIWRVTRTISSDRTTFRWMQTDSLLLKGGEKSHFARRLAVSLPYPVNPLMTEEGYDQRASRVQPLPPHAARSQDGGQHRRREHGLLGMNRLGPATRRAYDAIRHRLAHLEVRPGGRIEPLMVADELSISVTPVRDALHILAGEHLVELRHGDGYFAFPMEEADLRELYDWNQELVLSALRRRTPSGIALPEEDNDYSVQAVERIFTAIARASSSLIHADAMRWTNARLGAARHIEMTYELSGREELSAIHAAASSQDLAGLRRLLATYHTSRKRMARTVIKAMRTQAEL